MWLFLCPSAVISSNREKKHAGKISKKSSSRWEVFFILTLTWSCLVGLVESPGCVFWKVKLSKHPTLSWCNATWNVFPLKTWEKRQTIYLSKNIFFYPLKGLLCASRDWKDFLYTLFNAYRHCLTLGRTVFRRWEYLCLCVWQTVAWGHVLAGKNDEGNSESNEEPTSPIWSRKIKKKWGLWFH